MFRRRPHGEKAACERPFLRLGGKHERTNVISNELM
nr:MAG TPA: hypothetical protein [Caudoviricetes sp.]